MVCNAQQAVDLLTGQYLQLQPRLDEVGGEDACVRNHAGGSRAHPVEEVARLTCALTGHIAVV